MDYLGEEYKIQNPSWHVEDSLWKANQIAEILNKNSISPATVAEVGCGAGQVISNLSNLLSGVDKFEGFDISPIAIECASQNIGKNLSYNCADFTILKSFHDLALIIDVIEHIPDYIGFLKGILNRSEYKIFHIPLDIHISSVLRGKVDAARQSVGHLHYFTLETSLSSLESAGYKIIDYKLTAGAIELYKIHKTIRCGIANIPRRLVGFFSTQLSARIFGGYSALVLCR